MGITARLFTAGRQIASRIAREVREAATQPTAPPTRAELLPYYVGYGLFAPGFNDTSVDVSEELALTVSAVWSAVTCISDSFASLPAHIIDAKAERNLNHPLASIFNATPNEFMTAATFRTAMMMNALLWGNAYAFIAKDGARAVGLYPLLARLTTPARAADGSLWYRTNLAGRSAWLSPDQVFHVLGPSLDGITGLNPIQYARQTVGLSLVLERCAAKFFGSGANIGGVIEAPPGMPPAAQKSFLENWTKAYTSIDGAFKIAAMPPGIKFHPTSVDPEKSQAIQSRVHQIREVARIYHIPPHKLGDLERATFSNIEHQQVEYQQEAIQPWAIRWEQEANRKLLLEAERPLLELTFNLDSLLRADTAARYGAHNIGLQAGFLTVNEVRRKENLPPVAGGDVLRVPLNMGAATDTAASPTSAAAKAAQRQLIESVASRLVTKEAKAIGRALKKHATAPEQMRAWLTSFYAEHEQLVTRSLASVAPAAWPKKYCAAGRDTLLDAIDEKADVAELLEQWQDSRPAEIADELCN